jgi:hypothetical protein
MNDLSEIDLIRKKIIELRGLSINDLNEGITILKDFLSDPQMKKMVKDTYNFENGKIFVIWHNKNRIILRKEK